MPEAKWLRKLLKKYEELDSESSYIEGLASIITCAIADIEGKELPKEGLFQERQSHQEHAPDEIGGEDSGETKLCYSCKHEDRHPEDIEASACENPQGNDDFPNCYIKAEPES